MLWNRLQDVTKDMAELRNSCDPERLHGDKGGENGCFSMSMSVSFSFLRRVTSPAHVDSGSLLIRVAGHIVPEYSATAAILHITHASYIHISVATCHTGASAKAF